MVLYKLAILLHHQTKNNDAMNNKDLNTISKLFESENSYHVLVDMISDLDLEFKGAFAF